MNRIARFEKVSFKQYLKDFQEIFKEYNEKQIKEIYDSIKMPVRATKGSAGYDFMMPFSHTLNPNETLLVPSGIRCFIEEGYFLAIFPRSGLGYKYRLQLDNTVGIIDSDYYNAKNEGHIMIKITNDSKVGKILTLEKDKGFVQGIFMPFAITYEDQSNQERSGGFGSTDK